MTNIRRPKKTQEMIDKIRRETNPKIALESIVNLFENYINFEEKIPVRFDERTGKPVRYKWEPRKLEPGAYGGRFKPEIYLGGDGLVSPNPAEPGLSEEIVREIKENGSTVVDTQFGKYVFAYEERDASGPEPHSLPGTYHATRHLISVKKN